MGNTKGFTVLLVTTAAMMMFFAGCETTKYAGTMSAEELAALERSQAQGSSVPETNEQGDVPLVGRSLGEESLSVGGESETAVESVPSSQSAVPLISGESAVASISGESAVASISELSPERPPNPTLQESVEGGDISGVGTIDDTREFGYEGEKFARALTPLGDTNSGFRGPESGEEVVRLPDLTGGEESMNPLRKGELKKGGMSAADIELDDVYFGFDQFLIRQSSARTLQVNAQFLNAEYQNSGVLVEGHCDERGTSDYNLVLGERRARAVKDYLIDLGVLEPRIQIVSYGEERPSCTESKEFCWQQNRRAHFVLQ